MRIPVLMMLEAQEPLRESAAAAAAAVESSVNTFPFGAPRLPEGFILDSTKPAIPIGSGAMTESSAADVSQSLTPDKSDNFVVHGAIDVEDDGDIPEAVGGKPIFSNPPIASFLTCIGSPPVRDAQSIRSVIGAASLANAGLDGADVAVAIMDTGINLAHLTTKLGFTPRLDAANSGAVLQGASQPGRHPLGHGTMCAFDVLLTAPRATLLDFPILRNPAPGGSTSGQTLGTALQAYSQLLTGWAVSFAAGGLRRYKALVINNSWGIYHPSWDFPVGHPGRYIDNPQHVFNGVVALLARSGVDIIFAAGNCGNACPSGRCQGRTSGTIMGANASADVLTIGACDAQDQWIGYSSQGPSIAGMPQEKPDLVAFSHFLGSEADGPGQPDTGTSTACPIAAGCIAALRSKVSPASTPPANLFDQLRATARVPQGVNVWSPDFGYGIIDPVSTANSLGLGIVAGPVVS